MNRFYNIPVFFRHSIFLLIACLSLSLASYSQEDKDNDTITRAFYDTLKIRAEKNRLTRLLYDIVIVTPSTGNKMRENMESTRPFLRYEGMVIRKCDIIRLNAFGTNINDPSAQSPSRFEKTMNSTYIKTHNFVLKKYLLFGEGDTITPLRMADNERILRELSFIDDARIEVIPVTDSLADVIVIVRETYPLGFNLLMDDLTSGKVVVFHRNFGGLGHDFDFTMPYKFEEYPYPGIDLRYTVRNIAHSFSDLILDFSDGLGSTTASGTFSRKFISSETRYAWSASMRMTSTTEDLDTLADPAPLRYIYQDYWAARSFMLNRENVTRLIFSARYIHNNVFRRPQIDDFSYYRFQNYQLFMGGIALSQQKFINTTLIYSYGRTENIPYGYMLEASAGRENNEFKIRTYLGLKASYGNMLDGFGYLYGGVGFSTFYNNGNTEQGVLQSTLRYFTPLMQAGHSRIRAFVNIYYTRGFSRYFDEALYLKNAGLVRGFSNDSISGNHRLVVNLEQVLFLHKPLYGFKFAFFTFADGGYIIKGSLREGEYNNAFGFGVGVRIRNDQLVLNTFQIRFGIYPGAPLYSKTSWASVNGLVKLKPPGFEPEPPGVTPYR